MLKFELSYDLNSAFVCWRVVDGVFDNLVCVLRIDLVVFLVRSGEDAGKVS